MKAINTFSLLSTLLLSACFVDVYEIGNSSSSFYYSSSFLSDDSSSSQAINNELDSVHCEKQNYKQVEIGSQTWIAQNLNEMPRSGISWCSGGFDDRCNYGYGRLYDWEAAMSVCNTCDGGWELPTKEDYEVLSDVDADFLRSTSVWHAAFNGLRYDDENRGPFAFRDNYGYWWSSTDKDKWAYYSVLAKNGIKLNVSYEEKAYGFSVRCIKK